MSRPRNRVRVLVAENHPLYLRALVASIRERPELELIGSAEDGREALELIREMKPDVAILDVKMPELDGIAVLRALTREGSGTRVLMLSAFMEGPLIYEALAQGAHGYLSKDADRSEVCEAVSAVARGETILAAEIQGGIAEQIRVRGRVDRLQLTDREQEVLRHIAAGRSAPEIARQLSLSPATVKGYQLNLYEKLGVSDRAAAVAEAMRRGLIE